MKKAVIIISAGVGFIDPDLPWEKEKETLIYYKTVETDWVDTKVNA